MRPAPHIENLSADRPRTLNAVRRRRASLRRRSIAASIEGLESRALMAVLPPVTAAAPCRISSRARPTASPPIIRPRRSSSTRPTRRSSSRAGRRATAATTASTSTSRPPRRATAARAGASSSLVEPPPRPDRRPEPADPARHHRRHGRRRTATRASTCCRGTTTPRTRSATSTWRATRFSGGTASFITTQSLTTGSTAPTRSSSRPWPSTTTSRRYTDTTARRHPHDRRHVRQQRLRRLDDRTPPRPTSRRTSRRCRTG